VTSNTSRLSNDASHRLNLSLSTAESTELLLGELASTLLLRVSKQLNDSSLVGSKTSNLMDNVANKSVSGGSSTLSVRNTGSLDSRGDLVALVDADSNSC
jgi:hypothetical protein